VTGWADLARLRDRYKAAAHFEIDDYRAFVEEFGPRPV
jgi:hypothetical protein